MVSVIYPPFQIYFPGLNVLNHYFETLSSNIETKMYVSITFYRQLLTVVEIVHMYRANACAEIVIVQTA